MSLDRKIIMFTGGGGAGNEAIFRLLSYRYELYFVDSDISNIDPTIPLNNKRQIPPANDKNFLKVLKNICSDLEVDLLIPGVDEELLLIADSKDGWGKTQIMLPQASYVKVMLDKLKMIRALEENHILAPKTESLNHDIQNFDFPCIIKPREGRGSRGVFSVNNKEEVESFQRKIGNSIESYVLQSKYFGDEYTVQMIADSHGELICSVPVKLSLKKGITIKAKVNNNALVVEACKLIHEKIPCCGTYNIQLILTDDGLVYPFEINPRISTTFCLVLASGVDPIDIFFNGRINLSSISFKNGISLSRHWYNHFY